MNFHEEMVSRNLAKKSLVPQCSCSGSGVRGEVTSTTHVEGAHS